MHARWTEILGDIPRWGWVTQPSVVQRLADDESELGLDWFGVKRDDLLDGLYGGTKVRKLDTLLASPLYHSASVWASMGAIGSGHVANLVAAAQLLDRRVEAHMVWEPQSRGVLQNLAFTASGPSDLHYYSGFAGLALRNPSLIWGRGDGHRAVVARGATQPEGLLGIVAGGLELADQIVAGELPEPDGIVLPFGTGGTAAGLAVALQLAGLQTKVEAVSVVPRVVSGRGMLRKIIAGVTAQLTAIGVTVPGNPDARVHLVRGHLGRGYGHPTPQSAAACDRFASLPLEEVYSGKAMAALLASAPNYQHRRVLFWVTPHRPGLPCDPNWRDRLPPALRQRLTGQTRGLSRRRLVIGAVAVAGFSTLRLGFHPIIPGVKGHVLSNWEASVLAACVPVIIPDEPGGPMPPGPTPDEVAANVDRYLQGMPSFMRLEIHGLFALIEHGTGLGCGPMRFTRSSPVVRARMLANLGAMGTLPRQAYRGIRDLVLLGWYQDPRTWPAMGYEGPLIKAPRHIDAKYQRLLAPAGPPKTMFP